MRGRAPPSLGRGASPERGGRPDEGVDDGEGARASGARAATGAGASAPTAAAVTGGGAAAAVSASRSARAISSMRSTSLRSRAAASARARASRSSLERPRPAGPALSAAGGVAGGWAGLRATAGSETGAALATSGSAPPEPPSLRVLRFSTTTDLDRPWLKFCRTWPLSTVRCSDSGLRAPVRRVLSVVSLVSVMLFRSNSEILRSPCHQDALKPDR